MTYISKAKLPLTSVPDVLRSGGDATVFIHVPELQRALSQVRLEEEAGEIYAELSGLAAHNEGSVTRLKDYHLGYLTDEAVRILEPFADAPVPAKFVIAYPGAFHAREQ
jgi:hypothetical protein